MDILMNPYVLDPAAIPAVTPEVRDRLAAAEASSQEFLSHLGSSAVQSMRAEAAFSDDALSVVKE